MCSWNNVKIHLAPITTICLFYFLLFKKTKMQHERRSLSISLSHAAAAAAAAGPCLLCVSPWCHLHHNLSLFIAFNDSPSPFINSLSIFPDVAWIIFQLQQIKEKENPLQIHACVCVCVCVFPSPNKCTYDAMRTVLTPIYEWFWFLKHWYHLVHEHVEIRIFSCG